MWCAYKIQEQEVIRAFKPKTFCSSHNICYILDLTFSVSFISQGSLQGLCVNATHEHANRGVGTVISSLPNIGDFATLGPVDDLQIACERTQHMMQRNTITDYVSSK